MFEEARLYQCSDIVHPSIQAQSKVDSDINRHSHKLSRLEVVSYWHIKHQRWIRQWVAQGHIKKHPSAAPLTYWFLYTEYQDSIGNNLYIQNTFNSLYEASRYAETTILEQPLPQIALGD